MKRWPIVAAGLFAASSLVPARESRAQDSPAPSPVQHGLQYLRRTQVTPILEALFQGRDWSGNWPQFFYLEGLDDVKIRDVNPFMAACMFPCLELVSEENAATVGFTAEDLAAARLMRQRAVALMRRFQAPWPRWDAGTYGFWPLPGEGQVDVCPELAWYSWLLLGFDFLWGDRAPMNACFLIRPAWIPSDADDTAKILEARLVAAELDDAPPLPDGLERHFEQWRDLGGEPMRVEHAWMNHPTGAYLTWLAAGAWRPRRGTPQDVDLVVNANVLSFLGRYGRLDAAGAEDAIALINRAVGEGRHHRMADISAYYPDTYLFPYAVSRAYAHGGVSALAPAVEQLADELEAEAIELSGGLTAWSRGHPCLNTAFVVITLLNAGRDGPLVEGGVRFLLQGQDPNDGSWPAAPFFLGTTTRGAVGVWESRAMSTALAMEALMRAQLAARTSHGYDPRPQVD